MLYDYEISYMGVGNFLGKIRVTSKNIRVALDMAESMIADDPFEIFSIEKI